MSKIHLGNPQTGRAFCGGGFGVPRYDTEDPAKATCHRCKKIAQSKNNQQHQAQPIQGGQLKWHAA